MTTNTHTPDHHRLALLELESANDSRQLLAELYRAERKDFDRIGAVRQAVKFSMHAAQVHAALALVDKVEAVTPAELANVVTLFDGTEISQ